MELLGVFLRLSHAFGIRQVPPLGLDHGQLVVAVGQHIIGDVLGGALACPLQPSEGDHLTAHPARLHHAPARRLQGGVDQLGAGFGLVHATASCKDLLRLRGQFTGEGFLQDGLFQLGEAVQLLLVDGFEALEFVRREHSSLCNDASARSSDGKARRNSRMPDYVDAVMCGLPFPPENCASTCICDCRKYIEIDA